MLRGSNTVAWFAMLLFIQAVGIWVFIGYTPQQNSGDAATNADVATLSKQISAMQAQLLQLKSIRTESEQLHYELGDQPNITIDYEKLAQVMALADKEKNLKLHRNTDNSHGNHNVSPSLDNNSVPATQSNYSESLYSQESYELGLAVLDEATISGSISEENTQFIRDMLAQISDEDAEAYLNKIHEAVYSGGINPVLFVLN